MEVGIGLDAFWHTKNRPNKLWGTEITEAPIKGNIYLLTISHLSGHPYDETLKLISLVTKNFRGKYESKGVNKSFVETLKPQDNDSLALWMHPLFKENDFIYLDDEDDTWIDYANNRIARQPELIKLTTILKIKTISVEYEFLKDCYRKGDDVRRIVAKVEIIDAINLFDYIESDKLLENISKPLLYRDEHAKFEKLDIYTCMCHQDCLRWYMSTTRNRVEIPIIQNNNSLGDEMILEIKDPF